MKVVVTDYVPMDTENANWLYKMGAINNRGGIVRNKVCMMFRERNPKSGQTKEIEKETCSWSVICELIERVREQLGSHPDYAIMNLDTNDLLTLLRKQKLDVSYEIEGESYVANLSLDDEVRNRIGEWRSSVTQMEE